MPRMQLALPAVAPDEFSQAVHSQPVVVVHFWAEWNGVDRQMDALLQTLRPEFAGQIGFLSFDTDLPGGAEVCRRCRVLNLPSLVCFVGGERHETRTGLGKSQEIRDRLRAWARAGAP